MTIDSPGSLGGLTNPSYLALNPQGKMPLLTVNDDTDTPLAIPESDTIARYLISEYASEGPSFQPDHVKSNLVARIHDMYLTTIQGCLYKATPPFGIYRTRSDAIKEIKRQLDVIDDLLNGTGPYLFGEDVTLADATLFPTMIFANYMLPKMEGGVLESDENPLPPKIHTWFNAVMKHDEVFANVYEEVQGGLDAWESNNRWDSIFLAGVRDTHPPTIFDKILAKEIPADIVYEDDKALAFKDINPAAPFHVLVIPKDRMGLIRLSESSAEHVEILGHLFKIAGQILTENGGEGRIVINNGPSGGQEVDHLHIHVLGGRQMTWPPG